jgi:hypothetical protein
MRFFDNVVIVKFIGDLNESILYQCSRQRLASNLLLGGGVSLPGNPCVMPIFHIRFPFPSGIGMCG